MLMCVHVSSHNKLVHVSGILLKVVYCKIKRCFIFYCVCFLGIICVKSIGNLLHYNTIQSIVSWVPRLTLLDL